MYLKHVPNIIKPLAKHLIFDLPNNSNSIFLTFDDGPHPEITPWVMDQLEHFNARGTFFLIGNNVERYPKLLGEILERGHAIGNHSYSHQSGWKISDKEYLADVEECSKYVESHLYRPPYGEVSRSQSARLVNDYRIIMWSDLSADFDANYSPQQCVGFATKKVKAGSIIVFHDSDKAWSRLERCLPECLEYYTKAGFKMKTIATY